MWCFPNGAPQSSCFRSTWASFRNAGSWVPEIRISGVEVRNHMVSKLLRWFWSPVKLENQLTWLDRAGSVRGRAIYCLCDLGSWLNMSDPTFISELTHPLWDGALNTSLKELMWRFNGINEALNLALLLNKYDSFPPLPPPDPTR